MSLSIEAAQTAITDCSAQCRHEMKTIYRMSEGERRCRQAILQLFAGGDLGQITAILLGDAEGIPTDLLEEMLFGAEELSMGNRYGHRVARTALDDLKVLQLNEEETALCSATAQYINDVVGEKKSSGA